jgi:hypothetical protein
MIPSSRSTCAAPDRLERRASSAAREVGVLGLAPLEQCAQWRVGDLADLVLVAAGVRAVARVVEQSPHAAGAQAHLAGDLLHASPRLVQAHGLAPTLGAGRAADRAAVLAAPRAVIGGGGRDHAAHGEGSQLKRGQQAQLSRRDAPRRCAPDDRARRAAASMSRARAHAPAAGVGVGALELCVERSRDVGRTRRGRARTRVRPERALKHVESAGCLRPGRSGVGPRAASRPVGAGPGLSACAGAGDLPGP